MPLLTRVLVLSGLAITVLSVGWWWFTYRDVIGYDYMSFSDAGVCLVRNTDTCQLARSLCRSVHPLAVIAYWSASIWFGFAAMGASLVTGAARTA
jgi:hypothetical protein